MIAWILTYWVAIYAFIKFWLPLISAIGIVVKLYNSATARFYKWADSMVDSHTRLIAASVDKVGIAVSEMIACHRDTLERQLDIDHDIGQIKEIIHDHKQEVVNSHALILSGIEILKDKQDDVLEKLDKIKA